MTPCHHCCSEPPGRSFPHPQRPTSDTCRKSRCACHLPPRYARVPRTCPECPPGWFHQCGSGPRYGLQNLGPPSRSPPGSPTTRPCQPVSDVEPLPYPTPFSMVESLLNTA